MTESIINQQKIWTDDIHNMSGWICYSLWSIHQWQAVDTFNTSSENNDEFELKSSEKKLKYVSAHTLKQWKKKMPETDNDFTEIIYNSIKKKSNLLTAISGYFHHCFDT